MAYLGDSRRGTQSRIPYSIEDVIFDRCRKMLRFKRALVMFGYINEAYEWDLTDCNAVDKLVAAVEADEQQWHSQDNRRDWGGSTQQAYGEQNLKPWESPIPCTSYSRQTPGDGQNFSNMYVGPAPGQSFSNMQVGPAPGAW